MVHWKGTSGTQRVVVGAAGTLRPLAMMRQSGSRVHGD